MTAIVPEGSPLKLFRSSSRRESIPDYVDTLDGFRALATLLVMMFHYWQQSWVTMVLRPFGWPIDLTHIVSNGYVGVELLFLLSGFGLYYPLAMHPERRLSLGNYAYKRIVRILPSYFLCVLLCSAYQIGRLDPRVLREQFIGNMTLTQMRSASLHYNQLNGVLWTMAIEAQFYLLFPLLCPLFRRRPWAVMAVAFTVGEVWRGYLRDVDYSQISWLMNQLPGMIDCFVGGMLAAHMVALVKRKLPRRARRALSPAFAAGTLGAFLLLLLVMMYIAALRYNDMPENLSRIQMNTRKFLVTAFMGAVVCSVFMKRRWRLLLGNPVTRFLSTISYQVYLWHMWIALRLKDLRIPDYVTERPMDDPAWRFPYMMLSIGLTFLAAVALTYLFERPISRLAMKHMPRWARPRPLEEAKADG